MTAWMKIPAHLKTLQLVHHIIQGRDDPNGDLSTRDVLGLLDPQQDLYILPETAIDETLKKLFQKQSGLALPADKHLEGPASFDSLAQHIEEDPETYGPSFSGLMPSSRDNKWCLFVTEKAINALGINPKSLCTITRLTGISAESPVQTPT